MTTPTEKRLAEIEDYLSRDMDPYSPTHAQKAADCAEELLAEVKRLRDVILFEKERANEFGDYELACRIYRALRGEGSDNG